MFDIDIEQPEATAGDWFEYPGGGRIKLSLLSRDAFKEISKATTIRLEPVIKEIDGVHRRFDSTEVDFTLQFEMVLDKNIVEWEGFSDRNGKEIPCTMENKLRLMEIPAFNKFYNEKIQLLKKAEEAKQDEEKKI